MRLRQRDVELLLDFVRQTYAVQSMASFRAHVLRALPRLVPAEITAYNEVNLRTQHNDVVYDRPQAINLRDGARIFDRHIPEHPLIQFSKKRRWHGPVKISDFLSPAQFHRLGLYAEFFRPIGIEDQMVMSLPVPRPIVFGIAMNRNRRNFSGRDRLLLSLAFPHLLQAYRNAEAWTRTLGHMNALEDVLQKSGAAVIVSSSGGRIENMTQRASVLLTEYLGAGTVRGGRLPDVLQRWIAQQESQLAASSDAPATSEPLLIGQNGARLSVRLFRGELQTVLLLEESDAAPQRFDGFGLTRREEQVLAWVSRGKTNREIGAILSLSSRTVQKHVEHIFQKLGVETRTAAATKALASSGTSELRLNSKISVRHLTQRGG